MNLQVICILLTGFCSFLLCGPATTYLSLRKKDTHIFGFYLLSQLCLSLFPNSRSRSSRIVTTQGQCILKKYAPVQPRLHGELLCLLNKIYFFFPVASHWIYKPYLRADPMSFNGCPRQNELSGIFEEFLYHCFFSPTYWSFKLQFPIVCFYEICVCSSMFLYVFLVCFLFFCFILFLFVYCTYLLLFLLKRKVKNELIWKTEAVGRVWE